MKVVITLSKEVADRAEAEAIFIELKDKAAEDMDMTMSGYTNSEIPYDIGDGNGD